MSNFKIATWNVNSLRVRLPHVLTWLEQVKPDILALQEIKLINEDFPHAELNAIGYRTIASGQKTYNGVAVLSREESRDAITELPAFVDHQRRVLAVTVGDIRILNLYVPNGESVTSEKYQYKLNWLRSLNAFVQEEIAKHSKMILLGDFNIAPSDMDVYDPREWEGQVLFSLPERDALNSLLKIGFQDCFRLRAPDEKSFSWWDYRLNAFKRNMGLRIDHIFANTAFSQQCTNCYIDKNPRAWERPSDHAPVVAEFNLN